MVASFNIVMNHEIRRWDFLVIVRFKSRGQIFLLCNIKQTTSENAYILFESLAGNQINLLSNIFW